MKKLSLIILILLLSIFLLTCSDPWTLENKLDNFFQLLDEETITHFKKENFQQVELYLEKQLTNDEFKEKYLNLKKKEAINLFNNRQTIEFFFYSIYKKIKINEKK